MTILFILITILLFGALIAIHEFGHFIAAKTLGVRVEEFAIGMGPKLLSRTRGRRAYSLRALPIGGFCSMEGEEEASDDPRSFSGKPAWKKFIILVAGAFLNFVTGLVILLVLFSVAGSPSAPVVSGYLPGAEDIRETGPAARRRILPHRRAPHLFPERCDSFPGPGGGGCGRRGAPGRPAARSGHSAPALPYPHRRERPAEPEAGSHGGGAPGGRAPGHPAQRLVPVYRLRANGMAQSGGSDPRRGEPQRHGRPHRHLRHGR